jgi:hypothetical protein
MTEADYWKRDELEMRSKLCDAWSRIVEKQKFPNLTEMSEGDLVKLLAVYVHNSHLALDEFDKEFIDSIKAELKTRSGKKRLNFNEAEYRPKDENSQTAENDAASELE